MLNKVKLPAPGRYIVAVSGGIDSMVLLDVLTGHSRLELIVAHFNHGIRGDSLKDEKLVADAAKKYGLKLEIGRGHLGRKASEAAARQARYEFIEQVRNKYAARAIITAHHQDDVVETAFLNLLRGTGPDGIVAIINNQQILRPLLSTPRKDIEKYAKAHSVNWREDTTNQEDIYLRNYLRHQIMPSLTSLKRAELLNNIEKVAINTEEKEKLVATISQYIIDDGVIDRRRFLSLPTEVANELLKYWLQVHRSSDIDRKTINRLNVALRTAKPRTRVPVKDGLSLLFDTKTARFTPDTE